MRGLLRWSWCSAEEDRQETSKQVDNIVLDKWYILYEKNKVAKTEFSELMSVESALQWVKGRTFQKGIEGNALNRDWNRGCLRSRDMLWRAWRREEWKWNEERLDQNYIFSEMEAIWGLLAGSGEIRWSLKKDHTGCFLDSGWWGGGNKVKQEDWLGGSWAS